MQMPVASAPSASQLLAYQDAILPKVSRTFALTIPQLPEPLRCVVTNAYLLCRIADTIEDESALAVEQKQHFHELFLAAVSGDADGEDFGHELEPLLTVNALDAERDLVRNCGSVLAITRTFTPAQQSALFHCLTVMCHGMPRYQRHASVDGLPDQASLDRYCYCVAGVVGEALTELFSDYSQPVAEQHERMLRLGVSFGQGLQMVNILKDFWEDYGRGVCWLPQSVFRKAGIDLGSIVRGHCQPGFGKAYAHLIGLAHRHLRNGFEYTLLIPDAESGVRRFCLLALALALQTLQRIHQHPDFTSGQDVKVSRRTVTNTLIMTRLFAGWDRVLKRWFRRLGRGLPLQDTAQDWYEQVRKAV